MNGSLRAKFDSSHSLDLFEWIPTSSHREYVALDELRKTAMESPELKQSPSMSKNAAKRAQSQKNKELPIAKDQPRQIAVPKSLVNEYGLTPIVAHCLEVSRIGHNKDFR